MGQVTFTEVGPLGWIRFDNPGKRNAMTIDMWQALSRHLARAADLPDLRAVILVGEGKTFVSGSDISTFGERRSSPEAVAEYAAAVAEALASLARFPKPSLAAIRGSCVGGGVSIAVAADLRLAAEDAVFAIPAARLGIGYSIDQLARLRDLVGAGLCFRLIHLAEKLDAAEAMQRGLVQCSVPVSEFDDKLASWARALAEVAPLTLKAAKQVLVLLGPDAAEGDEQHARTAIAACMDSEDYREGQRAFAEKRRPQFQGR